MEWKCYKRPRCRARSAGEASTIQAYQHELFPLVRLFCTLRYYPQFTIFESFLFSIDGHNMTIIEADGIETEPITVDSLNIFAGMHNFRKWTSERLRTAYLPFHTAQRYSIIVSWDIRSCGNIY